MGNIQSMISLHDISVSRDERQILSITAHIPTTGITAVIGPNGSGKTTLLKLLHGLIEADEGSYSPGSQQLGSALVLHHTPLIKASVRCNLAMVRDSSSNTKITESDIDSALASVGLSHLKNQSALKLSAGERQRLSLARAKLQRPQVILLDEPTANLDPSTTEQVETIIKNLALEGCGVIFTSHHLGQVQSLSDQVVFLADGQCLEVSNTENFFKHPQSDQAKKFIHRELGWK
ncbi:MAG: ATP-binding cassette domain-containing protein [Polynucleobacter victoriensis]